MADSVSQISKNNDKNKFVNSINRTTSETLRISEGERGVIQPNSLNVTSSNPKKKTSFQITSVTIGSRMSNDGGDDSADDLDESHTDDVSEVNDTSRATDIERETPSYSEDTFSKDDVFFNASASLASAPVIPTSSQYGLAILDSNDAGEVINSTEVGSNLPESELALVTEKVINLVSAKHDPEVRDSPHTHTTRSERFKVVKIESTEPFKRGRWVCMDYLDHTTSPQTGTVSSKPQETAPSSNQPTTGGDSGNPRPITVVNIASKVGPEESTPHPIDSINPISTSIPIESSQMGSNQLPVSSSSNTPYTSSPGQSLQSNVVMNPSISSIPQHGQSLSQVPIQHSVAPTSNQHTSLQPQQIQQVLANANLIQPQQPPPQQIPTQPPPIMQQPIAMQQQLQQLQQQQQQQFQQQQQQFQALQQQQQQQSQQMLLQQQMAAAQQMHLNMPHVGMQPVIPTYPPQTSQQYPPFQPNIPMQPILQPQIQQQYYPIQSIPSQVPGTHVPIQNFPAQTILPPQQPTQVPTGYTIPMSSHVPTPTAQPAPVQSVPPVAVPPQNFVTIPSSSCTTYNSGSVVSSVPSTVLDTTTPSSDISESATPAAALLESLAAVNTEEPPPGDDSESASGASAVAIDNKIEQAMDLVKSHLMFAVREEVEVLKEKISELMERINQLETENTLLRQHATQETLAQLPQVIAPLPQAQPPPQPQQANTST